MASKSKQLDLEALDAACAAPEVSHRWDDGVEVYAWGARWDALCAMLVKPEWERGADQWMARAEAALEAWPDEVRSWPHAWLRRKVAPRATRLVRTLQLGAQAAATHEAIFAQLATLDAQTRPPLTRVGFGHTNYNLKKTPTNLIDPPQAAILMDLLADSPRKSLLIHGGDSEPLWEALAASPAMSTVRMLSVSLHKNPFIPRARYEALFEAILDSAHTSALEVLDVYLYDRGQIAERTAALITERHAARLTALSPAVLRDDALRDRFADARWPALRKLVLRDAMSMAQLDRWLRNAPALESLEAWGRMTGSLPAGGEGPRLRELALGHMELAVEVEALLRSARCEALERMSLYQVPLTAGALGALGAMPLKRALIMPPTGDAPWSLWRGLRLAHVTALQLRCPSAADLLSLDLPALTHLAVTLGSLSDAELDAVERAPWFGQLKYLSINARPAAPALRARVDDLHARFRG